MPLPAVAPPPGPVPSFDELYERIRAMPESLTAEILEPGTIRTMSRPGRAHRRAAKCCSAALDPFDANVGGEGWWIELEPEIRFPGGRLLVPDLAGYQVDRIPDLPSDNPLRVLPDWCCEVLSPRTARDDITVKLPLYARSGIPWIWIVDPARKVVEVFETVGARPALTATAKADERVVLPPFGVAIAVAPWWLPGADDEE